MINKFIPWRFLIISDFFFKQKQRVIKINKNSFNSIFIDNFSLVEIFVEKEIFPDGRLVLKIESMEDFEFLNIISKNSQLRKTASIRDEVEKMIKENKDTSFIFENIDLDELPFEFFPDIGIELKNSQNTVDQILDMVDTGEKPDSKGSEYMLLVKIDKFFEALEKEIFSSDLFIDLKKKLHSLFYIWEKCKNLENFEIFLFSSDNSTAESGLENISSELLNGMDLIFFDYIFTNSYFDMNIIKCLAELSNDNLIPSIITPSLSFFGTDSYLEFSDLPYMGNYMDDERFTLWRQIWSGGEGFWINPCIYSKSSYKISPLYLLCILMIESIKDQGWPFFKGNKKIKHETMGLGFEEEVVTGCESVDKSIDYSRYEELFEYGFIIVDSDQYSFFVPEEPVKLYTGIVLSRAVKILMDMKDKGYDAYDMKRLKEDFLSIASGFYPDLKYNFFDIEFKREESDGDILLKVAITPSFISLKDRITFDIRW